MFGTLHFIYCINRSIARKVLLMRKCYLSFPNIRFVRFAMQVENLETGQHSAFENNLYFKTRSPPSPQSSISPPNNYEVNGQKQQ